MVHCRAKFVGLLASAAVALALPAVAQAQTVGTKQSFTIAAQDLGKALTALGRQSNREIYFPSDLTRGKRAPSVRGTMTTDKALEQLLAGSGLTYRINGAGAIVVRSAVGNGDAGDNAGNSEATSESDVESIDGPEILVTGTRIRGAVTASPTTTITSGQIREEGRTDLGQVIRNIPQNFNGGQNPGVLSGAGATNLSNRNAGGGSALNLRGLGPDATLTLLNGKRLSYSGYNNAIDVSAIPIAAVERFEIITDGASAIYGSDAVAGVANIILRRDFDGLTTAVRGGVKTRGGGEEYQLSLTGGTKWNAGAILVAYDRAEADPIFARQRDYITGLVDPSAIARDTTRDSFLLSGHQELGSRASFSLDAMYTRRTTLGISSFPGLIFESPTEVRSLTIAPSVEIDLLAGWTGKVSASYGRDKNVFRSIALNATTGAKLSDIGGCYCNTTRVIEGGVEGPLFDVPGGAVRMAAGGGYRRNAFHNRPKEGTGTPFGGSASSHYVYGELNVPVVSPAMDVAAIHRLNLSGALRYEKYNRVSGTTTPKLGIVYGPTADFTLKGSWGRSFRAASLRQQFEPGYGFLTYARNFGGDYPPDAVALFVMGPNPYLKPERSESLTATLSVHPEKFPGLSIDASYFKINYTDRVISPINNIFAAFSEPAYAPFITLSPTAAQIDAALAQAGAGYTNNVGGDNYASVAIIDSSYANATSDRVSGFDLSGTYRFELGGGEAVVRGSGSWLRGRRQLLDGGATLQTAGILFNPPKFRGRAGVTWTRDGLGIAAFFNHLDGVFANYFVVDPGKTDSFNAVDLNIRYALPPSRGLLSGLEFALTIDNALDAKPPLYEVSIANLPNFDSTNYSAIGRTISLTVTKSW